VKSILVVDDHPVIAKACRLVLEPLGIENVVSASTVDAGYEAFVEHEPDVSVVDLTLHKEHLAGITLIKRIRAYAPAANILVFSMRSDRNSFFSAIEAGASGYVIKDSPTREFTKAIEEVRSGRRYIDTQLALNLSFSRNAALSSREQRIIYLLRDTPVEREVGLETNRC
jgi:DNA-binding NarL/FixJ family response regulator